MEIQITDRKVRLGVGGYGSVFRGTYRGNEVAVKRVELIKDDDNASDREANILKQLDHPNTVKLYHFETDENFKYYALELCDASMDQLFLAGKAEDSQKYKCQELLSDLIVFSQLAEGLKYIHSKDLIHRDIKPENVLISMDSTGKITMKWTDFGMSRPVNERGTYTMNSGIKGTRNWIAPELLLEIEKCNQPDLLEPLRGTVKSDVFAEALLFAYFILKGEHLYGSNESEISQNIVNDKPINMNKINERAPYVCELISKMLTSDPSSRMTSSDVVQELQTIVSEKKLGLRSPSPLYEALPIGRNNEEESVDTELFDYLKKSRFAIYLAIQCSTNKRILDDGTTIYKLQLNKITTLSGSCTTSHFSFGEPIPLTKKPWKKILLMGANGSGKTTVINAMINYILGVEWNDTFRFLLIDEKVREGTAQAHHSQTQQVTAYDFHYQEGFRIPFSLTIVDTPGFAGTSGIDRDQNITLAVEHFFKDENRIQELDIVGFIVQSSLTGLTDSQKNNFSSVLNIFGKDIEENVRYLVTFADESSTPVLEAIKEAELPLWMDSKGRPCHQKFNHDAFYQSKNLTSNTKLSQSRWEDGIKNFNSFFEEIKQMPTKSLNRTKVMESLKTQMDSAQSNINEQLKNMEISEKTEKIITCNIDKYDANEQYEIKVQVSIKMKGSNESTSCSSDKK